MNNLKMGINSFIGIATMGFATLLPLGALADTHQYDLALTGIPGSATVAGISDLIPISSFGKSGINSLHVSRPVDVSSPYLHQAVAEGTLFSVATLYAFESTGGAAPHLYETFTFSSVIASSELVSSGGGGIPEESVGFSYKDLTITAVPEPGTVWLMLLGLGGLALRTFAPAGINLLRTRRAVEPVVS